LQRKRFLAAALGDARREGLEGGELQQRARALALDHVDERVVRQAQRHVAQARGRLCLERREDRRDQPRVLLRRLGLGAVAYDGPLHGLSSSWLRLQDAGAGVKDSAARRFLAGANPSWGAARPCLAGDRAGGDRRRGMARLEQRWILGLTAAGAF